MSKVKKIINYEFDDGAHQIPATYIATCTVTGNKVPIYHKNLVKLIESKYKNNFNFFVNNYISPEAAKELELNEDPFKINIYGKYLILCYKEAVSKNDAYTAYSCTEKFEKNFKKDIKQFLNDPS